MPHAYTTIHMTLLHYIVISDILQVKQENDLKTQLQEKEDLIDQLKTQIHDQPEEGAGVNGGEGGANGGGIPIIRVGGAIGGTIGTIAGHLLESFLF